ncbi:MAG: hypothetical protein HY556_08855 [Euryarchaeota archaeon]|nr:hypothetical protein [Euryarchaeota archaeon]
MKARSALLAMAMLVLAGCVQTTPSEAEVDAAASLVAGLPTLPSITIENAMTFTQSVVVPAKAVIDDLYEPTMEVSDSGTIYVAGHVIEAATTGTPAYFSNDNGATWKQLPFVANVESPIQGAQPPPGDEGVIVAGANGQAWMADIYAAGFTVTGWCDNGASQCYDNRYAYDRAASTLGCKPASLNDRPWAAYASGSLLLVNNPGGGPMQIGVMAVPPAQPVGVFDVNGPTWNTCASTGGSIPGVPTMRADGRFAVPQMVASGEEQVLTVVIGSKDNIFDVETVKVFPVTSAGAGTTNGGRTAFDKDGTLFVAARNNTRADGDKPIQGNFVVAVSLDAGQTFKNATFPVGTAVRSIYVDGNMAGAGALLAWSQVNADDNATSDWYVGHVFAGPDGRPVLVDVTLAVAKGPHSSAHVMGAAAGPDGRAYFMNFKDTSTTPAEYAGSTPLSVWIQKDGPRLPTLATV